MLKKNIKNINKILLLQVFLSVCLYPSVDKLITAAFYGNVKEVSALLNTGVDPNSIVGFGLTALGCAIDNNHVEVVRELLKNNRVNPNILNIRGDPVLIVAVAQGNMDIVIELLKNNRTDPNLQNSRGETALMAAVEGHSKEIVIELLKDSRTDPNIEDNYGNTALSKAIKEGDADMVALLSKRAEKDYEDLAMLLFDEKINTDQKEIITDPPINDNVGDIALPKAVEKDYEDRIDNFANDLINAASSGDVDKVSALLKSGVDPNSTDEYGNTALTRASYSGHVEVVKELLKNNGVNPNIKSYSGLNALMVAAREGYMDIVVELLKNNKTDPSIQDIWGMDALMGAIIHDRPEIVKYLHDAQKLNQLNIPENSLFCSFEQDDKNGAITRLVIYALLHKVIVVCSSHLLKQLIDKFPTIVEYYLPSWSLFINKKRDLGVIVPEKIGEDSLSNKYGLKNLEHIQSDCAAGIMHTPIKTVSDDNFGDLIAHFGEIIDSTELGHPVSLLLIGHGLTNISVAAIPMEFIKNFFDVMDTIQAKFVYILSCYSAGQNLQTMQNVSQSNIKEQKRDRLYQTSREITKKFKPSPSPETPKQFKVNRVRKPIRKPITRADYAIVIQAVSDVITVGMGNVNKFFSTLNLFLKKPLWSLGRRMPEKSVQQPVSQESASTAQPVQEIKISVPTITDVIDALGIKHAAALPSIRFPGTNSFFRAIDLKDMEIVTWARINSMRLHNLLAVPAVKRMGLSNALDVLKAELNELSSQKTSIDSQKMRSRGAAELKGQIHELQKRLDSLEKKNEPQQSIFKLEEERRSALKELERVTRAQITMELSEADAAQQEKFLRERIEGLDSKIGRPKEVGITITVKPEIKYIQVFPMDLHDCTFVIEGTHIPKFISKIPGHGQHYIGTIKYASKATTLSAAIEEFVDRGFVYALTLGDKNYFLSSNKAWFIDSLELTIGKNVVTIRKLIILSKAGYFNNYVYQATDNRYYDKLGSVTKDKVSGILSSIKQTTCPTYDALVEATGGNESILSLSETDSWSEESACDHMVEMFLDQ